MNPTLTICICTSGRPAELARALKSIREGTRQPDQVVVSDDSATESMSLIIRTCCQDHSVDYTRGPCRGLCANRNHVVHTATSEYLSLIDDDAVVGESFVESAFEALAVRPAFIISGDVLESGLTLSAPTNPRLLGHFGKEIKQGYALENINLNCNIFPRRAFELAQFDESIAYGYEDTDLCANLLSKGFEIRHLPKLVNTHLPPKTFSNAAERRDQAERARFRVMIRKWGLWQRDLPRLITFASIAPIHLFLHCVRHGRFRQSLHGWPWVLIDIVMLMQLRRTQRKVR